MSVVLYILARDIYMGPPVMLQHFGVPICNFVIVSGINFVAILHEFGQYALWMEEVEKQYYPASIFAAVLILFSKSVQINQWFDWDLTSILLCEKFAYLEAMLVFQCSLAVFGFVHCPVTAVICRSLAAPEALEHMRPAFLCISWDLQALGTDTSIGQTSKACSCCSNLGKQNSVSVAVSWKLLSWPFLMNRQLNVCVCWVSKSVFFVFFSGCLHAPLPQVYLYFSQWADINEESWKRWGWSLAFRLLCACVLLSLLLGLRPERTNVYVIYASVTLSCLCVLHAYCIANIFCLWRNP